MTTDLFFMPALPQKPPSSFPADRTRAYSPDPSSKTEPPGWSKGHKHENFLSTLKKVSRDRDLSEGSRDHASHAPTRADKTDRNAHNEQKIDRQSANEDGLEDEMSPLNKDEVSRNDQTPVAIELKELIALLEKLGLKCSSAELIGEIQSDALKPGSDMSTGLERLQQLIANALAAENSGNSSSNPQDGLNLNQTPGSVDLVNWLKGIIQGQENANPSNGAMAGEGTGGEKTPEIFAAMTRAALESETVSKAPGSIKAEENSQIPSPPENPEKSVAASETAKTAKVLEMVPGNGSVTDDEIEMAGKAGNSNRNAHFSRALASADSGRHSGGEPLQENSVTGDSSPVSKLINDAQVVKENFLKADSALGDDTGSKVVKTEAGTNDSGQLTSQTQTFEKALEIASSAKETEAAHRELRTQTMEQIVRRAVILGRDGQHEARIDLKPEFLGHVRMQVITENQQVTVKILTEFGFVKDMIENNIQQLKADLQQHGLNVDKVDVSVSRDADGNQHSQGNTDQAKNHRPATDHTGGGNAREENQNPKKHAALTADGSATVDYFA